MTYQSKLAEEYARLMNKYGDNPRPSRVKQLNKLKRYLRRTL